MIENEQRLMTLKEVAEKLNVGTWTIFYLAREGNLPAVKIRNHWRFDPAAVQAWLETVRHSK